MSDLPTTAYGDATLDAPETVVAGEYATWTITYTAGPLGVDDGGTLKVTTEMGSDWGPPQFEEPDAENYSSVHTSASADLEASYDARGYVRPWTKTVDIRVSNGTLSPGDTITLILGDRRHDSPGIQAQSFIETGFEFRPVIDVFETGEYLPVSTDLQFDVVAGSAESLDAVLPATATRGESIELHVRARDRWGNVTDGISGPLRFDAAAEVSTPDSASILDGTATVPVTFDEAGVHRLTVTGGGLETTSNPLVCNAPEEVRESQTYWGDIHGQSEETIGAGTIDEYFEFGRDAGFLDFAAPANHDFQMSDEIWEQVRDAVRTFNDPGSFVTFLSYEWTANTPAGGDHNVYFREDEPDLKRASNWQVKADDEPHDGVFPIDELYDAYKGRDDVLIVPHQGGRPASLDVLDPDLTPFLEMCSLWGVFEWFAHEALERGHPVGFIAGSDDTTGRLGATYPSTMEWHHVPGGLMAAKAPTLTREALWEAFTSRRVYATTGARVLLSVNVDGASMGATVESSTPIRMDVDVHGTAPVTRIDAFRGTEVFATHDCTDGDDRLEAVWTGLHSKNRRKHVDWSGDLRLNEGTIRDVDAFGFHGPDQGIDEVSDGIVTWTGSTVGNVQGLVMDVDAPDDAVVTIETPHVDTSLRVTDLDATHEYDRGPVGKRMLVQPTGNATDHDVHETFVDDAPTGRHPYYVRIQQRDGEMAWSSPIFVEVP